MNLIKENDTRLGSLKVGDCFLVESLHEADVSPNLLQRLMELGFHSGQKGRVVSQAPIFHDPVIIEIQGSVFALRRQDANCIQVYCVNSSKGTDG